MGGRGGNFGNWMSVAGFNIWRVGGINPGIPPLRVGAAAGNVGFRRFSLSVVGRNNNDGTLFDVGLLAASNLSAMPPCLYPFVSFLMAYCTEICLPLKYWLFIWVIAMSLDSKLS